MFSFLFKIKKKGGSIENLYREFNEGKVLYDVDEGIESEEAEGVVNKYYEAIANSNGEFSQVLGISKVDNNYIFKVGSDNPFSNHVIVKHSIEGLDKRLEFNETIESNKFKKEEQKKRANLNRKIKNSKKEVQKNNNTKEKYLIVEKINRGEITKVYIFKDKDLDVNYKVLKEYELATKSKFNQDIKYLNTIEYKEALREIKLKNKKLNNDLER